MPDDSLLFDEPPRVLSAEEKAFDDAATAYERMFGSIPYGVGYPEITTELLRQAVASGSEIEMDIPDGTIA